MRNIVRIAESKGNIRGSWENKEYSWGDFKDKLKNPVRVEETIKELDKLKTSNKSVYDKLKNNTGFIGGKIKGNKRRKENIEYHTMLTLDIDETERNIKDLRTYIDRLKEEEISFVYHPTFSCRSNNVSLHLIIPLEGEIFKDNEYKILVRAMFEFLGLEGCKSSEKFNQLMYYPKTAKDFDYETYYGEYDGNFLSKEFTKELIRKYRVNHRDDIDIIIDKKIREQQDPLSKEGYIGLFCRTYSIQEVIEQYLGDVYELSDDYSRATFINGTTKNGLVIYNDVFAYSHHSTDPTHEKLCNAFDLVRIHKFGDLDSKVKNDVATEKLPSFKKMIELVGSDVEVMKVERQEKLKEAEIEFNKDEDTEWLSKLSRSKNGTIIRNFTNLVTILENDENLKGCVVYDSFGYKYLKVKPFSWDKAKTLRNNQCLDDKDILELMLYIGRVYGIDMSKDKVCDAIHNVANNQAINPPLDYINSLEWDGKQRIERLLCDYFGAEDTEYTRAVTKKWLCGAIQRILEPGCKFDYMLVLISAQGRGKSSFFYKLSKGWFTDSLKDVNGNQAIEKIYGSWIIEIAELQALSKADSNAMKGFITAREDKARMAYAREPEVRQRQCVFVGTTNEEEFLKDTTGNRRYWPVNCLNKKGSKKWQDLKDEEIDQIWAEAKHFLDRGEDLYLSEELEREAAAAQSKHMISDDRQGLVEEYINKPIPAKWDDMDLYARINYLEDSPLESAKGTVKREFISPIEVWCECFGKPKAEFKRRESLEINKILSSIKGLEKTSYRMRTKLYGLQRVFKVL